MILRIDKLAIELPMPKNPSPNSAAAVQELLGGKFGEMSTLMNYTFQSFNFRGRNKLRPYYDLIANIAAEEYSHIELVSHESMPLTPEPSTVHGSPGASGLGSSGEHFVAFQELPPSFAHGMHFSPFGQSCAHTSHSIEVPPKSVGHPP